MEWRYNDHIITVSEHGQFEIAHEDDPDNNLETRNLFREAVDRTLDLKRAAVKTARKAIAIPVLRSNGDAATIKGYNASSGYPRLDGETTGRSHRSEVYYHLTNAATLLDECAALTKTLEHKQTALNQYLIPTHRGVRMTGDDILELEDQLIGKYDMLKGSEYATGSVEIMTEPTPPH